MLRTDYQSPDARETNTSGILRSHQVDRHSKNNIDDKFILKYKIIYEFSEWLFIEQFFWRFSIQLSDVKLIQFELGLWISL